MGYDFFTSDLHFSHANIQTYCIKRQQLWHNDIDAMNEGLIARWNSVVTKDDNVLVLGDVAMGKIKESLPLAKELNGHKHLLAGNHDRCFAGLKNNEKWLDFYIECGFELIYQHGPIELEIDSVQVVADHFPFEGDSQDEDRYKDFRPSRQFVANKFLLCGHIHDKWRTNGRQINVGVDCWDFYPVRKDTILELIDDWT